MPPTTATKNLSRTGRDTRSQGPTLRDLPVVAAVLMLLGGVQYLVLEAITASAWHNPPYNYAVNFISDLGNPVPHDVFNGTLVNSPLNLLMDVAFLTQGVLFIVATLVLWRRVPGRVKAVLLVLGLVHAVGIILVGIFHENSTVPVSLIVPHFVGAFAAILGANLLAIMVGVIGARVSAPGWYRITSIVLGLIGIAGFVWLQSDHHIYVTAGGLPERIAVYAVVAWECVTGLALLVAHRRRRTAA